MNHKLKTKNADVHVSKYLEAEQKQKEMRDVKIVALAGVMGSLVFAFMTIINILKHSNILFSTAFGSVSFLLAAIITWRTKRKRAGIIIAAMVIAVMFSLYAIEGSNDGFAILWILLVPGVSLLALGVFDGIVLTVYFACFLIVLFYTPLQQYIQ